MKILYLLIFAFTILSCQQGPRNYVELDFGPFKMTTPKGWRALNGNSIDSYHGGLTNGIDSIWFDYGMYGVDFGEKEKDCLVAIDTVNGLDARLLKSKDIKQGIAIMVVPKVTESNQFTIWCHSAKEVEVVLKIYKSIVFEKSDTSINPPLVDSKFFDINHVDGKSLFKQNCAACHSIIKNFTGPALKDITLKRTNNWIYNFLAKRDTIKKDSLYLALKKEYKFSCVLFPDITAEEVDAIVKYINRKPGY